MSHEFVPFEIVAWLKIGDTKIACHMFFLGVSGYSKWIKLFLLGWIVICASFPAVYAPLIV